MKLSEIKNRVDIAGWLEQEGKTGLGLEVGVQHGFFTHQLASNWKSAKRIYGVDCWKRQENYDDACNIPDRLQLRNYRGAIERVRDLDVTLYRMMSGEFRDLVGYTNEVFDLIYIDSNHSYETSLEEFHQWWDVVGVGGLLAGHDYVDASTHLGDYGVKRAVHEFMKGRQIGGERLHVTSDNNDASWIIQKRGDDIH